SGSSPGLRPPSRSMSATVPPPTHGPVRSIFPSGSRGIGWLFSSESLSTGVPGLMKATPPSMFSPLADGVPLLTSRVVSPPCAAPSPPALLPPRPWAPSCVAMTSAHPAAIRTCLTDNPFENYRIISADAVRPPTDADGRARRAAAAPARGFRRSVRRRVRSAHLGTAPAERPLQAGRVRGVLRRRAGVGRRVRRGRSRHRPDDRIVEVLRLRRGPQRDRDRVDVPAARVLGRRLQQGDEGADAAARLPLRQLGRLHGRSEQ